VNTTTTAEAETIPARERIAAEIHALLPARIGRLTWGSIQITGPARSFAVVADDDGSVVIQVWGGTRVEHESLPAGMTHAQMVEHIVRVATEENPAPVGEFFTGLC
jgi:hypothetical protein